VVVRSGKGDAYREVPLNALVRQVLEEWLKERARPSTSRRYGPHKRLRANYLRRRTAEGRYRHREHSCAGRPDHPPGQTDIATFARTLVGEPLWKHQLEGARSTARTR
jgi:hypothetical protein